LGQIINTPERKKQSEKIYGMAFNSNYGIEAIICTVPERLFGIAIPREPDATQNIATLA
jgi:hypothetical protein